MCLNNPVRSSAWYPSRGDHNVHATPRTGRLSGRVHVGTIFFSMMSTISCISLAERVLPSSWRSSKYCPFDGCFPIKSLDVIPEHKNVGSARWSLEHI